MPRFLKRGMDASAIKAADAKVRQTVEGILAQVEERKDVAIRELSQQFDNWSPPSFKLTPQEVERAISQVAKRDLDDIRFAQEQVRNFAQKQKDTMHDLEVETLPGVVLGHKHIPVSSIGCSCYRTRPVYVCRGRCGSRCRARSRGRRRTGRR
jgi:sulfopropanediol 3-dehydrogenase